MNWKRELEDNVTTAKELQDYFHWNLPKDDEKKLKEIIKRYPMSVSKYYLSLINPHIENDEIKKLCIPSIEETDLSGSFDTSGEKNNTVVVGLQHKYKQTALILSTNKCAAYCRHCFRKRLVGVNDEEINKHFGDIITYIKEHKEINNVLITGGDAFVNSNRIIEDYLKELNEIEHIKLIRFGTRVPVVLPTRIYNDKELLNILEMYSKKKTIYVVTQFNHPREITEESKRAVNCLTNLGITVKNQTVLLKGVNNNPVTMAKLINKIIEIGVIPYYIFQCRPVVGVKNQFQVPLKEGYRIITETRKLLSGQGKCFRYVLSNEKGKIEVIGDLNKDNLIFKYHQAKSDEDEEKVFTLDIDDNQCWI
ncbi:MAG TPA: KamA family radical SAM protein [Clostridiales bacterium]|nr:KamA family radical SAM protein [Clostridiales bacterium]